MKELNIFKKLEPSLSNKLNNRLVLFLMLCILSKILITPAFAQEKNDNSTLHSSKIININFTNEINKNDDYIVIGILKDLKLYNKVKELDQESNNIIYDMLKLRNFKGEFGEIFYGVLKLNDEKIKPFILLGLGDNTNLDGLKFLELGGKLSIIFKKEKIKSASILLPNLSALNSNKLAEGLISRSYVFDKYKTNNGKKEKNNISIITDDIDQANESYKKTLSIYSNIYLTRDLATEPANVLTPNSFAEICQKLKNIGVEVEVLNKESIKKLGMNALLGVAQGSANEPKVVILKWYGSPNDKKARPIAFLGKGVTFDSGGLSLKSVEQMDGVKCDMTGAAVVTSVIKTLAERKAKVNAIGILGLVENMPDGNAQRPGDIVISMAGKSIEVLNTDAEGRLVLADILWYCQERFKPKLMIDLATLTGTMIMTLGTEYAGFFSNNEELANNLIQSGLRTGEKIWRFPLDPVYDTQLESEVADVQNMGSEGNAKSIVAAQFLQRFVNNDIPWVHIDIAGAAWYEKDTDIVPKGASGYGIKLLNDLIEKYYEGVDNEK